MGVKFIDKYSLLHFASGIVAFHFGINFWTWFIIHMVFEILENTECGMHIIQQIHIWPGGKDTADSLLNSIGDQVFGLLGWLLAALLH
jgi:hypothetical protein